jgi:anaerobic magnesium-protoporphyrin IX monomethyl ester cyclase
MKYAVVVADAFTLGPAYIISHLRAAGHEVKLIFDPMQHSAGGTKDTWLSRLFSVENYNFEQIKNFHPDAVLFGCLTAHYQWALRFAKRVKDGIGCKIIFGGVHVTSVPEVVKQNVWIDEVVTGCGIKHFGLEFQPDVIFPAWQDFYNELPPCHRIHPIMMTNFGCPFSCTFCLPKELKITYARRTIDGCIRELIELKRLGAKRVSIWDDSFTIGEPWLFSFLKEYKRKVNIPFRCLTNPLIMSPKIAHALAEAGCYTIDMGIQTGNEQLRREVLNRRETNEQFLLSCKAIKDAGITLVVDHIFEIPGESDETNRESYELYSQARPDFIHCFKLLYFPKARIIDKAVACGILSIGDVQRINEGRHVLYASGEHQRVAEINPWVRKMLSIPLGGKAYEKLPDWAIKLLCYIRIGKDFLPQTIIQNQIYFTLKRIYKCLKK